MEAILSENVAAPRFRTLLFALFAGLAVCLAMASVYGVMAYAVGQRSNEIGLRIALGATVSSVLRLILGQGLTLAGLGLAFGLAAAAASAARPQAGERRRQGQVSVVNTSDGCRFEVRLPALAGAPASP